MQLEDVPRINAKRRRGSADPPGPRAPNVPAAPAWASTSPAPSGVPAWSPIAAAASGVSPRPSGAPGWARFCADTGIIVGFEEPKAHAVEEFLRPTLLMREIAEFACRRAGRAGQRSRGAEGQEIGEIEEMSGIGDCFRFASGEPGQLGRMHLGRDLAAHVAQRVVRGQR